MASLSQVPFLSGYVEADRMNRAQEAQGLQTLVQMMQMQRMQQQAQQEQQNAPLVAAERQARIGELQAHANERALKEKTYNRKNELFNVLKTAPPGSPEYQTAMREFQMMEDPKSMFKTYAAPKPEEEWGGSQQTPTKRQVWRDDSGKVVKEGPWIPMHARQVAPVVNIGTGARLTASQEKAAEKKDKALQAAIAGNEYALEGVGQIENRLSKILGVQESDLPDVLGADLTKATEAIAPAAGPIQGRIPYATTLSPFKASDIRSNVENLKMLAQTYGLEGMKARGVSPGTITEKEWPKFAARLGNIDLNLSDELLAKELSDIYKESGAKKEKLKAGIEEIKAKSGAQIEGERRFNEAKSPAGKTVVREVKLKDGRTGVEYSDGSRGYK